MIDLYFWPTPNGKKVTILLEELGMAYRVIPVDIGRGDQFAEDFLRISPNNRMPAIVDTEPADGGAPVSVFESGAILMYLAEKAGRFFPQALRPRYEVTQWVMWQMANQGPKFGEAGHFRRLGDTKGDQSYANARFGNEQHRLYGVMNVRLHDRRWLAGDEYTIADVIAFPWTAKWKDHGVDLDEFPYFRRWWRQMDARPGVRRGMEVGADLSSNRAALPKEEQERIAALLYQQRARPAPEGGLL